MQRHDDRVRRGAGGRNESEGTPLPQLCLMSQIFGLEAGLNKAKRQTHYSRAP